MSSDRAPAWVPSDETFGARLALVRQRLGWNVKEAALACKLPPQSWRGWELGHEPRSMGEVSRKIADRTGVDEFWLVTGRRAENGPGPGATQDRGRGLPRLDSDQQPSDYRPLAFAA